MFCRSAAIHQLLAPWPLSATSRICGMFGKPQSFHPPLVSRTVRALPVQQRVVQDAIAYQQPETFALWHRLLVHKDVTETNYERG